MHATCHLLARSRRSEPLFFFRMLALVAAIGLAPFVASEAWARSLPPLSWFYVAGSGVCCGAYFTFLALAYQRGDFTVVYPVVRALPVLLVALGDLFLCRWPTAAGWTGVVLVAAGCALSPLHSLREVTHRHYFNRGTLWMALAAVSTVGYTLLDKTAADIVEQGPATAARYG